MTEAGYIRYRKLKAFGNKVVFHLCRIFPIKKNRIAVCTFEGKGGFGCNPKYIVEELHRRNPKYEFVWMVNEFKHDFPDYIKPVNDAKLWSRAYWLSTSKVWIDNYRKPFGTCKRKKQFYLNTWHGTIYIKPIGLYRGSAFSTMARLVSENDSNMIDAFMVDSDWCEKASKKGSLYDGNYLKFGAARCDILHGAKEKERISFRKKHNIPEDAIVVMYAPTFREGATNGKRSVFAENWTLDFNRLIETFEKKYNKECYICLRVHPQLAKLYEDVDASEFGKKIVDESQADDMYEIMAAMDAYITDYSSAAFEAGFAKIPVFIYADDIEKYRSDRGGIMWDMTNENKPYPESINPEESVELPFDIATNNDELEAFIGDFDKDKYENRIDEFSKSMGHIFEGNASGKIADVLEEKMLK